MKATDLETIFNISKASGMKFSGSDIAGLSRLADFNPDAFDSLVGTMAYGYNTYGKKAFSAKTPMPYLKAQYDYYKKRTDAGLEPVDIADANWNPSQYDDDTNEALALWHKQNKALPSAYQQTEFNSLLGQYKQSKVQSAASLAGIKTPVSALPSFGTDWQQDYQYNQNDPEDMQRRAQGIPPASYLALYGNDAADQQRLAAGQQPVKIERTRRFAGELQQYKAEIARAVDNGTYTDQTAKDLLARFPELNAAKILSDSTSTDPDTYYTGGTDKLAKYYQTDVLQRLGYDPQRGLSAIFGSGGQDASQARAAAITQQWKQAAANGDIGPTAQASPQGQPSTGGRNDTYERGPDGRLQQAMPTQTQGGVPGGLSAIQASGDRTQNYGILNPLLALLRKSNDVTQKTPTLATAAQSAANARDNLVHSPFGAGVTAATNSATFGIPGLMEKGTALLEERAGIPESKRLAPIIQQSAAEHPTASTVGELAGMLVPGAGADVAATKVLSKTFPKLADSLLKTAVAGGLSTAVQQAALDVGKGNDAEEVAMNTLYAAALGAFGGAGIRMVSELAGTLIPKAGSVLWNQMMKNGTLVERLRPASSSLARTLSGLNAMEAEQAAAARAQNAAADAAEAPYVAARNIETPKTLTPAEAERAGIAKANPPEVFRGTDTGVTLKPGQEAPLALPEGKPVTGRQPTKFGSEKIQVNAITPAELQQLKKSGVIPQATMRSALAKDAAGNVYHVDPMGGASTSMDRPLLLPAGRKPFTRITPYESAGTAWGNPQRLAEMQAKPLANGAKRLQVIAVTQEELAQVKATGAVPQATVRTALAKDAEGNVYRLGARQATDEPMTFVTRQEPVARVAAAEMPTSGTGSGRTAALAADDVVPAEGRTMALDADDTATLTIDPKSGKPMPVGTPGQKAFDMEVEPPAGMKERGLSGNIRTDANSPDNLRQSFSADPTFYKEVSNEETLTKAQAIYAKGEAAARSELYRLNERMAPEAVPLAKLLARDAAARGDIATAREVLSDVSERLTTAGQYSQAAQILRNADPDTFVMTVDKQLTKLNKDGAKVYGKRWDDIDLTADELDEIQRLSPGDTGAYDALMEKIQSRIAGELPATVLEKLTAWRHLSMLLNPKTHIRNFLGNALQSALNKGAEKVSGLIQGAVLPQKLRTQAVVVGKDARAAAKEFFAAHEKELTQQTGKYSEGLGLNMPNKRVFKTKALESVRKFNYWALQTEDKLFYRQSFQDRLASAMSARGMKTADGITADMVQLAKTAAEKATFQDSHAITTAISKIKKTKGFGLVADTIMPFSKTPINITRRGLDYSPVGVVKGVAKLFKKETAAEGIDDLAKGLTGTGIIALGYELASKGVLTGAQDDDADKAAYDKATGTTAFQIVPLGITYDWAQPAAIPLSVGVAVYDTLKDDPRAQAQMRKAIESGDTEAISQLSLSFGKALLAGYAAGTDTIYGLSVMQGISDLFDDPGAALMKVPVSYVTQMVPTISGQAAGAIDSTVRRTNYGTNLLADPEGYTKTALATAQAKIPFASRALEPQVNQLGEDATRNPNGFLRAFNQFVNPGNTVNPQTVDPTVDTELRRLFDEGQTKQFPLAVDKKFTFAGKTLNLTPAEFTQYQRTTGLQAMNAMRGVITAPEYREMPKKVKDEKLKALAARRGTTISSQDNRDTIKRLTDEYRAGLLADAINYGRALAQLEIIRQRGLLDASITSKTLAPMMSGVSQEDANRLLK